MLQPWTIIGGRLRLVLVLIVAATVLPVAWYLGSPLFLNRRVDEGFPPAHALAQNRPAGGMRGSATPAVLRRGAFGALDLLHKGEGQAIIFQLPDGQRLLRFEHFRVQNGPDLYVYLSGHPAPQNSAEVHQAGAFEVARLKGNVGDQNYALPRDLDLSRFTSAVIYCKRFSHVFSTAELVPVR